MFGNTDAFSLTLTFLPTDSPPPVFPDEPLLDKIMDVIPKCSLQELVGQFNNFLMYAVTDCPICIVYPCLSRDVHSLSSSCLTLKSTKNLSNCYATRTSPFVLCVFSCWINIMKTMIPVLLASIMMSSPWQCSFYGSILMYVTSSCTSCFICFHLTFPSWTCQ